MTVTNYFVDQAHPGYAVIDINYAADGIKGANWTQNLTINFDGYSRTDWDNGSWGEFGSKRNNSIYYYSDSEIASHTNGNSISFHDMPWQGNRNFSFEAQLSLRMPGEGNILTLTWGYRNNANASNPLTLYPLQVVYHKY